MSKAKLAAAKELIYEEHFAEASALLDTVGEGSEDYEKVAVYRQAIQDRAGTSDFPTYNPPATAAPAPAPASASTSQKFLQGRSFISEEQLEKVQSLTNSVIHVDPKTGERKLKRFALIRLFFSKEVPFIWKLFPFLAVVYLFFPIDFIPEFIPVIGQMDDIGVLFLGFQGFMAFVLKALAPIDNPELAPEVNP